MLLWRASFLAPCQAEGIGNPSPPSGVAALLAVLVLTLLLER